jgi:hypothetical protein
MQMAAEQCKKPRFSRGFLRFRVQAPRSRRGLLQCNPMQGVTPGARAVRHHFVQPLGTCGFEVLTNHLCSPLVGDGKESLVWHVFRHSFCSNCAARGVDQRIINAWVGHQTEEMVRRYRHPIPNQQQEAIRLVFGDQPRRTAVSRTNSVALQTRETAGNPLPQGLSIGKCGKGAETTSGEALRSEYA